MHGGDYEISVTRIYEIRIKILSLWLDKIDFIYA